MNSPPSLTLAPLDRAHGYPVYAFIRRRGAPPLEAQALTRDFFANLPHTAATPRGLRTLVLTALLHQPADATHHADDTHDDATPPLDLHDAEARFDREPAAPALTPEEAFDHDWAKSTIERAIAQLRSEYATSPHSALVDALGPFIWGGSLPPPQAETAAALGMTEHAFTAAVHHLRHRLRDHLRRLVATTVADPALTEGELRFLLAAVRRRPVAA